MSKKAFTLIEVLIVIVIISALAAMVLPRLTGRPEQARIAAAKFDINSNIATALKLYELDNGFFPSTEQGLQALLSKPAHRPLPTNWNGPYLERPPIDPWGRPYQYLCPGTHGFDYDLYSFGPDERDDSTNISNWE